MLLYFPFHFHRLYPPLERFHFHKTLKPLWLVVNISFICMKFGENYTYIKCYTRFSQSGKKAANKTPEKKNRKNIHGSWLTWCKRVLCTENMYQRKNEFDADKMTFTLLGIHWFNVMAFWAIAKFNVYVKIKTTDWRSQPSYQSLIVWRSAQQTKTQYIIIITVIECCVVSCYLFSFFFFFALVVKYLRWFQSG